MGLFENSGTHTAGEVDDGPGFLSSLKSYTSRAETEAGKLGWEIVKDLIDGDSYYSQDFNFVKDTEYPNGPVDSVSFGPAGINEPSAQNLSDYVGTELWNKWLDHIDMILKNQDNEYVDDLAKERKLVVKHSHKTAKQMDDEDFIFNFEDLKVYIDPQSFTYLKGTKVDFVSEGVNEEVKFLNPNVKSVCGCGETFEING